MRTLQEELNELGRRMRHLVAVVKDQLCQAVSKRMPSRLLYFAVIRGIAIATGGPEYGNTDVPGIMAMEVASRLGKAYE